MERLKDQQTESAESVDAYVADLESKYLDPRIMMPIYAFLQENPGEPVYVVDFNDPGKPVGTIMVSDSNMMVKIGRNIYAVTKGMNDERFRLTGESAKKIGEHAVKKEIGSVIQETRGFVDSYTDKAPDEEKVEQPAGSFREVLCKVLRKGDSSFISYTTRVRGRRDEIEYIFQKCSEEECKALIEYAKSEKIPYHKEKGGVEILIYGDPLEDEIVDLLKNYGYHADHCMPARVKVEDNGIVFYPAICDC